MTLWTDDLFTRMESIGDPKADAVVSDVFHKYGIERVNDIMLHLVRNDELVAQGLPTEVQDYLVQSGTLPPWADMQKLNKASDFFDGFGAEVVMILFCASLPIVYADQNVSAVLTLTTGLTKRVHRRIVETAQFVMDVMAPGAFSPNGQGIRTAQKVRLMHAAVRHLIEHHPDWGGKWDSRLGVPIHQSSLAGTMLTFCVTIIDSLRKSGIKVEEDEREAYIHMWKVVGHIMGISDELMPTDANDADALMEAWSNCYLQPTDNSIALTTALRDFLFSQLDNPIMKGLIVEWMRLWTGSHLSDKLQIPRDHLARWVRNLQRLYWRFLELINYRWPALAKINRVIIRNILEGILDFERGGNRPQFRIPDTLLDTVGLK
jgi:hypothetical protein